MKNRYLNKYLILALFFLAIDNGRAHQIEVVSSNRDASVIERYEKEAQEISLVAEKLGYHMPPKHLLTFVPSGDLGQLSSLGRYPLPHWYDGAQVFNSMSQISGVLEFVTKGDPVSKSFYSDTTDFEHQISIIMHVIGHNDFALNSGYILSNKNATMPDSLDLYNFMNDLYIEYDHDQVSLFLQWLYSIEYLQDLVGGTYQAPENFSVESPSVNELVRFRRDALNQKRSGVNPTPNKVHTASVLSALVNQQDPAVPQWRKELMAKFEQMVRHYPGNIHTKIINEGWATYSQYLLVKHTNWSQREDVFIKFAGLMHGVAFPQVSNPYWLGLETWKNIYKNYRLENKSKVDTELELDQGFVKYAHSIMRNKSSFDFLRHGLDEEWIKDNKLLLYREATAEEIDKYCGDDPACRPKEGEKSLIILSRNPGRIINYIARDQADFSSSFPQIKLTSFNDNGNGGIGLLHHNRNNLSLNLHSAAQTLYILSLILEKPVSLKTFLNAYDEKNEVFSQHPIKLEVNPSGDIRASGDIIEQSNRESFEKNLQESIEIYKNDLEFSESEVQSDFRKKKFHDEICKNFMNHILAPTKQTCCERHSHGGFISHAPTSGRAIIEFDSIMKERFSRMLSLAIQGKHKINKKKNSVGFRVLPFIPRIEFDQKAQNMLLSKLPPSPVDKRSSLPSRPYTLGQDDASSIGKHPFAMPGDIVNVPAGEGGGSKGEPGEEEEGTPDDDGDPAAGSENQEPTEVEISLADWGKALQEELGLPNIRKTLLGKSRQVTKKKGGKTSRDHGDIIYRETLPKAINYPLIEDLLAERDLDLGDVVDKLVEGIPYLGPSDYVVKNRKEKIKPHNKAVIAIVMDFSGSMQGEPHQAAANLVYNFKALMLNQYEELEFRFIVYDTKAYEFSEDDVFGKNPKFLGGGTSNTAGYEMAKDILDEYKYEEWNKYLLGLGDAGAADGPETSRVMEQIYKEAQFMAFVYTENGFWGDQNFLNSMQDLAKKHKWAAYAELENSSQSSVIRVLKELFPPRT